VFAPATREPEMPRSGDAEYVCSGAPASNAEIASHFDFGETWRYAIGRRRVAWRSCHDLTGCSRWGQTTADHSAEIAVFGSGFVYGGGRLPIISGRFSADWLEGLVTADCAGARSRRVTVDASGAEREHLIDNRGTY